MRALALALFYLPARARNPQKRITDDILQISRLRLGRYTVDQSDFCVEELVYGGIRMFQAEAVASHIRLEYVPQSPKSHVTGDTHRISQILVNLLSNAIKFTRLVPVRLVRVIATVEPPRPATVAGLDARPRALVLKIIDSGIGITIEEQAKLFAPFAQASAKTFTTYGGSGMGLFITKELLELMGGSIRVDSEPGLGTTFTATIPVRAEGDVKVDVDAETRSRDTPTTAPTAVPLRSAVKRPRDDTHPFTLLGLVGVGARGRPGAGVGRGVWGWWCMGVGVGVGWGVGGGISME